MAQSGIESAIRELQREHGRIQETISMLKNFRSPVKPARRKRGGVRRLSAQARRRISEAAKRRWAARRASKGG